MGCPIVDSIELVGYGVTPHPMHLAEWGDLILEAFAGVFHQFLALFEAHTTPVRVYNFFQVPGQDCLLYVHCIRSEIRFQIASSRWAENRTYFGDLWAGAIIFSVSNDASMQAESRRPDFGAIWLSLQWVGTLGVDQLLADLFLLSIWAENSDLWLVWCTLLDACQSMTCRLTCGSDLPCCGLGIGRCMLVHDRVCCDWQWFLALEFVLSCVGAHGRLDACCLGWPLG